MVTAVESWERVHPNSDSSGSKNAPVVERKAAAATRASTVTAATSQARWIRGVFRGTVLRTGSAGDEGSVKGLAFWQGRG
ncbi:hypothetical protein GCM10017711_23090 [Paeniglutamicibacter sulfureus]